MCHATKTHSPLKAAVAVLANEHVDLCQKQCHQDPREAHHQRREPALGGCACSDIAIADSPATRRQPQRAQTQSAICAGANPVAVTERRYQHAPARRQQHGSHSAEQRIRWQPQKVSGATGRRGTNGATSAGHQHHSKHVAATARVCSHERKDAHTTTTAARQSQHKTGPVNSISRHKRSGGTATDAVPAAGANTSAIQK